MRETWEKGFFDCAIRDCTVSSLSLVIFLKVMGRDKGACDAVSSILEEKVEEKSEVVDDRLRCQ